MVQRANSRQAACGGLPVKDKPVIITAAEVAAAIKGDAPNDELVRLIRDSPEQSHGLLEQLSRDRDPVVRAWVPPVARTVLRKDAVPLIIRMAREDRDVDVRDVAIEELLELDRDAARSMVPLFRKKLRSSDPFEPLTAMWALAAVGDEGAVDLIRAKIAGRQPNALDRMNGEVVIMLMTNLSEILRRIRDHDHDRMLMLSKAAALMGTHEAVEALRACADRAPDSQCRENCREDLERLKAHD